MKKVYLVTLCTCLVVIAFVSASVYFLRDEEKEITVGFVYVGDASTAYTSNFIDAQEHTAGKRLSTGSGLSESRIVWY